MPWYFWVWGTLSCLALLAMLVGLVVLILYLAAMSRNREAIRELQHELARLENQLTIQKRKVQTLSTQIMLEREERNAFGRIVP